jgi:DNA-binding IclR family transcriptional regulator
MPYTILSKGQEIARLRRLGWSISSERHGWDVSCVVCGWVDNYLSLDAMIDGCDAHDRFAH